MTDKQRLMDALPLDDGKLAVRPCTRHDMDVLSRWPSYPWPDHGFRFSFAGLGTSQLDELFEQRVNDSRRVTLVADEGSIPCVGYVALLQIGWEQGAVGDMSLRIAPDFCGRGIGSRVIQLVGRWCLQGGLNTLRLSVAASNVRAVRCYEKAGFVRREEFWQREATPSPCLLGGKGYDFLGPHGRVVDGDGGGEVQIRFWWMRRCYDDSR